MNWQTEELNRCRKEYLEKEMKSLEKEMKELEEQQLVNDFQSQWQYALEAPKLVPHDVSNVWNGEIENSVARQRIQAMMNEVSRDIMQVFYFGEKKHPDGKNTPNFLTENGNKCSMKDRGSSILRHAARTFMNPKVKDEESNLPELLHLLSSVCIMYYRSKYDIIHPDDKS